MTDEAFNRYLKRRVRDEIPAVSDEDPYVVMKDGIPRIVYIHNGTIGPNPIRTANIIALGMYEAALELIRREYE